MAQPFRVLSVSQDKMGEAIRRLLAVADDTGMVNAGRLGDIAGREAGGSLEDWERARKRVLTKSPHTMAFMADPVNVVAQQYPKAMRDDAIAVALDEFGFQNVLPGQKMIALAHPSRNALFALDSPLAGGWAHYKPYAKRAGMMELAAGHKVTEHELRRALHHEARHMIEQGSVESALSPLDDAYEINMGLFGSRGKFPQKQFEYLSSPYEEMARLGDLRARYAGLRGKLISSDDEAEEAMQMMARNEAGVGDGFLPDEREFYTKGRQGSDAIRARQDWLLQRLLAVPMAAGAAMEQE